MIHNNSLLKIYYGVLFFVLLINVGCLTKVFSDEPKAPITKAPTNSWIKVSEESSGARAWPIFFFEPKLKKFYLSSGGIGSVAHFDTEIFDISISKWFNAYPTNAPYKNESGPTDAIGSNFSHKDKSPIKKDANGVTRINRDQVPLQMSDINPYFQFAYDHDKNKLYAYFRDCTLEFDPIEKQWVDLNIAPFSKSFAKDTRLLYGSLAYDPINKEILSIGGTSDEDGGTPGTWVFNIATKEWRKLTLGSTELKALNTEADDLYRKVNSFLNACRNRFYVAESELETKVNLETVAIELTSKIENLITKLKTTKLIGFEKNIQEIALVELNKTLSDLKALSGKLNGIITSNILIEIQNVLDVILHIERTLDVEPCGRGMSQLATDPINGKIILFGGCRLDSYLSDTWIYDCKTRSWEQRFPKTNPAPRAGHTLAWLPKSGKIVLHGGAIFSCSYGVPHGNPKTPLDLWFYDIATNDWKLLAKQTNEGPFDGVGAVDSNDTLIVVSRDPKKLANRITWSLNVDTTSPEPDSSAYGVMPHTITNCFNTPTDYDKATQPKADVIAKILETLPDNLWTLLPNPPKNTNQHGWGTCLYDPVRHQLLFYGGAHGAWQYTDIGHYSIRTATWSTGYADEYPFVSPGFNSRFNQTFNNHPCIPGHVWDSGACDPVSGKAIYAMRGGTWIYDPATRNWEYPVIPKPFHSFEDELRQSLGSSPKGVVALTDKGDLFLFEEKIKTWKKLDVNGGKLFGGYGDATGICYDAKRNSLWLSRDGVAMNMYCYDMASGAFTTTAVQGPERVFMRETVYIPEIDMLLNLGRVKGISGEIGNLAYDIENKKWVGIQMECSDNKPRLYDNQYWPFAMGLHYDAELKIAIFEFSTQEILVARMNKKSLKTFEVKWQEANKK
jgi:hypothetical protein